MGTPHLLKKIIELERSQNHLKQEMTRLKESAELRKKQPHSLSATRNICDGAPLRKGRRIQGPIDLRAEVSEGVESAGKFTDQQYLDILQSMAQAVHVFDLNMKIVLWNAMAEKQFGYSAEEAVGQNPINVMVDDHDAAFAMNVAQRCATGETWTGEFPLKNKSGERFSAVTTVSPFYDDQGSFVGLISVTSDTTPYLHPKIPVAKLKGEEGETSASPTRNTFASKLGLESNGGALISKLGFKSDQPVKVAITSKISDLASKVRNKAMLKMRSGDSKVSEGGSGDSQHMDYDLVSNTLADQRDDAASNGANTPRVDFIQSPFGVFTYDDAKVPLETFKDSRDESDKMSAIRKKLTYKAEEWMAKKRLSWPWKGNEQESLTERHTQNEQVKYKLHQNNPCFGVKSGKHAFESNKPIDNEASSLRSSSIDASSGSKSSTVMNKVDTDSLEYEILWDDLTIREQIGKGSCGIVYRGLWFGSEVAVKVFSKQEYSEELIQSSRQEVSLMKRLRHPNVMLFMGAVTSPQRFCIVSEFLPRGSLFCLLRRSNSKLDWRRCIRMALDIACGMNYLHCCSPPIVHRDLKSSNLLVDRNWTVKVADFGLSRIKHDTYLSTKSGKGTPQWMAPEVLRNESADEKSDIYSFGVVLWELATEKIPWETLNSMQVIGTVGFMNQRLEIPKDIDPRWVSIMESCWHSDTKLRPTFQELMEILKDLLRKYTLEFQANRAPLTDNSP